MNNKLSMKIPISTKNKDNSLFKTTNSFNNIISINSKGNIGNKMTPTNQKTNLKNIININNDNKENKENKDSINTTNYVKTTNESISTTKDQIKISSFNLKSCSNSSINQNHFKITNNSLTNESKINVEKLNRVMKENPFIQAVENQSVESTKEKTTNNLSQFITNNKLVTKIKTFQSSSTARDNKMQEEEMILKTLNNPDKLGQNNNDSKKNSILCLSVKENSNKYKDPIINKQSNLKNSILSLTPSNSNKNDTKQINYNINPLNDFKKSNLAFVNYSNKNEVLNKNSLSQTNKSESNFITKTPSSSSNRELSNKELKNSKINKFDVDNGNQLSKNSNNPELSEAKVTLLLPPKTTRNTDITEKLKTEPSIIESNKFKNTSEKEVLSQSKIESFKELKYVNDKKEKEDKFKLKLDKVKYSNQGYGVINAYSATTNQGKVRNYNEDRVSIILNINKPSNKEETLFWPKCSFFGIYDGHAGSTCADFLRDNLHKFIINDKNFPENPQLAILNGFILAEKLFLEFSQNNRCSSGSCAIVILIVEKRCFVANLGDSRAIMSGSCGEKVYILSRDHKPNDEREYKRIIEAGGQIYQTEANIVSKNGNENILGPFRVKPGKLSVTRTIGDMEAKLPIYGGNLNVVIGIPDIKYFEIHEHYDFILLGCKFA